MADETFTARPALTVTRTVFAGNLTGRAESATSTTGRSADD
jgi:hypothetical protein